MKSPFAPEDFPDMPPVKGLRFAVAASGERYKDRPDLLLALLPEGAQTAGVFTTSATRAAPVDWCRDILDVHHSGAEGPRALVVNAGNANAFTGEAGTKAIIAISDYLAGWFSSETQWINSDILVASTGVIGEPVNLSALMEALPTLVKKVQAETLLDWQQAAGSIMTTDTYPKAASRTCRIGEQTITLAGIAKGSGMIAPNMATMLAFIFTDAKVPAPVLQSLLTESVDKSFHCLSVDSDTSTNDTVLLMATGAVDHQTVEDPDNPILSEFRTALTELCHDLSMQIIKDAEGISKLISVEMRGAVSDESARQLGLSIVNSPLLKTAIAGGDANWGRVVMALGKAGEPIERDQLTIAIGGVSVAAAGGPVADYHEDLLAAHLSGRDILIVVDAGTGGPGQATIWGSDLTHDYIAINADYRS